MDARERTLFAWSLAAKLVFVAIVLSVTGLSAPLSSLESDGYLPLAQNLYEHGAFSYSSEAPFISEAMHAPGYPVFLAITAVPWGSIIPTFLIQAFLLSLCTVLLYRLAAGVFEERTRFFGALVFGLEPFTSYAAATALSESLFLTLFIGGLLMLRRAYEHRGFKRFASAGFLMSLALMVRPIILYALPLMALFVLCVGHVSARARLFALVGFLAGLVVLPGAWALRNYQAYGVPVLATKGPYTLYFYNAELLLEHTRGLSPSEATEELVRIARERYPEVRSKEDMRSPAYAQYLSSEALELIAESPITYAKIHVSGLFTLFLSDGYRLLRNELLEDAYPMPNITKSILTGSFGMVWDYFKESPFSALLFFLGAAFWGLASLLAFSASIALILPGTSARTRTYIGLGLLCIAYFALMTGPLAQARYRIVITPFLFMLASHSFFAYLVPVFQTLRRRYARRVV